MAIQIGKFKTVFAQEYDREYGGRWIWTAYYKECDILISSITQPEETRRYKNRQDAEIAALHAIQVEEDKCRAKEYVFSIEIDNEPAQEIARGNWEGVQPEIAEFGRSLFGDGWVLVDEKLMCYGEFDLSFAYAIRDTSESRRPDRILRLDLATATEKPLP